MLFLIASVLSPADRPAADTSLTQEKLIVERLPDLNVARSGHCVFCAGGELTVVGGHTSGFVLTPTAEYYTEGSWHLAPTVYPHDDGMAVVLGDGRGVLIAGGHEKNLGIGQRFEAELYYPKTHTFKGFSCLDRKRAFAQGAELPSGEVVIVGNHHGDDAFEMFDGQRAFRFVKEASVWRSSPYVLPVGGEEAIVFGTVWRDGRFQPCDTVLRLQGEPFCAPLLKEWMPLSYDQNNHCEESFIGDKAKGDFSYLVAARNRAGEIAFLYIHDTVFSLLPTTCTVPTASKWGHIKYDRCAIADRTAQRAYLVGNDSTGRVYVVAVEYGKRPSPITLYYSDPLPDFGNVTPVLTPAGNLVVTGGIIDDNFSPLASVWLLKTGDDELLSSFPLRSSPSSPLEGDRGVLWALLGMGLSVGIVLTAWHIQKRRRSPQAPPLPPSRGDETSTDELMDRIAGLMEKEQMHLNPELKIGDVAEILGVHRNVVSACISARHGCTFSQFVNDYRLQHAKKLLLEASELKISAIGLESGFATERSFFRAFKSATGMTPREWKALKDSEE